MSGEMGSRIPKTIPTYYMLDEMGLRMQCVGNSIKMRSYIHEVNNCYPADCHKRENKFGQLLQ